MGLLISNIIIAETIPRCNVIIENQRFDSTKCQRIPQQ
jgi:hypothetical protein